MSYLHLATGKFPAHPREAMPHKDWPEIVPTATADTFGYVWVFPAPHTDDQVLQGAILTPKGHWEEVWK